MKMYLCILCENNCFISNYVTKLYAYYLLNAVSTLHELTKKRPCTWWWWKMEQCRSI